MKFFTKYNRPAVAGFSFKKKSMTDQSAAALHDVQAIVKRFGLGAFQAPDPSKFQDVFQIQEEGGFAGLMENIQTVKNAFFTLNAETRAKFNNDENTFARFIASGTKQDFADLGLLKEVKDAVGDAINGSAGNLAPDEGAVSGSMPAGNGAAAAI